MTRPLVALDLFAGTGWGVACRILGIEEYGVELMPEAVATRAANGMRTIYRDVWEGLERPALLTDAMRDARRTALERIDAGVETIYDMLIASPPCQTFSMAGKGAGREALDEVVALIDAKAYLDVKALRAFGEAHDMRTALVLTPLSHIARDVPTYVVLEQVPTVLPVWERMAEELRGWGYSVVTGVLNAEQYGVPQTRKRAILIARADGIEAAMPTPSHSRYHDRNPSRLDDGVEPWIPMATALGWSGLVGFPRLADSDDVVTIDGVDYRARDLRSTDLPAQTVTEKARSWTVTPGVDFVGHQYPDHKSPTRPNERQRRGADKPAPTITSGSRSAQWSPARADEVELVSNKRSRSAHRRGDQPAPTITAGHDSGDRVWRPAEPGDLKVRTSMGEPKVDGRNGSHELDPAARPAHTVTTKAGEWRVNDQSGTARDASWPERRPTTTVATRDLIADPGHNKSRHDKGDGPSATKSRNDGIRVTLEEAARLQTYPADFDWTPEVPVYRNGIDTGKTKPMSKTVGFRQVGNAVPPLLALRVLETITGALDG